MFWKRLLKHEDGQSVVIGAIALIAVLAMTGIVVDTGLSYIKASQYQNAVDAAVLAAGSKLPVPVSEENDNKKIACKLFLLDYLNKNSIPPEDIAATTVVFGDIVGGNYTSVKATVTTYVQYGFGPIVGINGKTVIKSAKSKIQTVTASDDIVPLGVEKGAFQTALAAGSGSIDFIVKDTGGGGEEGFYGAIDLDSVQGGGAPDFEIWLMYGYGGNIYLGDILPIEAGNMAGPTYDAFTARYSQCTHFPGDGGCNALHFDPDCPRVIQLLVYTMVDSHTVKVEGYAPFVLKTITESGEIVASYVKVKTQEGSPTEVSDSTPSYGLYKISLVE
jgi:hypothetical protein